MPRVKRDNPAKHFIAAFLIALVLYVVAYGWIEHRRNRKGPWEVTFAGDAAPPEMIINQPRLGISAVTIVFPNSYFPMNKAQPTTIPTNGGASESPDLSPTQQPRAFSNRTVMSFAQARPVPYAVPFGTCVFMDTTFLPGTVSFTNIFGHDIELLPRVLIIDRQEHSWKTGERIVLR
jgi:hypothetical protein